MQTTSAPSEAAGQAMRPHHWMPFATLICATLFADFVLVAGHDFQRVLEIGVLLLGAAGLLASRTAILGRLFTGASGKLLAVFFLFGILGSAGAWSPRMAFFEVSVFFLLYVAALAIAGEVARRGTQALYPINQAIAVAGAFYTVIFFVAYVGSFSLGIPLDISDFTPGFSNVRFFNHAQTPTLPLLILLCCLTPRESRLRWLWLAVTTYWWLALFATGGRGTLAGMAAGCTVAAILLRKSALPFLKQVVFGAALGLLAYAVLLVAVPALLGQPGIGAFSSTLERTAADPVSGRMVLWRRAAELIMQHPLLGVGPMHFAHHAHELHTGAHPHDWLLQIASEWGLPALACLLAALGLALRVLLRAARRAAGAGDAGNRDVGAALLIAGVAILVDGLVSGLFVMPVSQVAIALYLGCAFGWCRTIVPAAPAPAVRPMWRIGGAMLVAAAMVGLAGVGPAALAKLRGEPLSAAQQALNTGSTWPRLWKPGFF